MKVGKGTRQGDKVMDEDKTNQKKGDADEKQRVDLLMKGKAATCTSIVSPH